MNIKPNYDNSIVNLSSSIAEALGVEVKNTPLKSINPKELKKHKTIILLIIDGLGKSTYENHPNQLMNNYKATEITSTFPSATTAALTTFQTALSPQEHNSLAWRSNRLDLDHNLYPILGITRDTKKALSEESIPLEKAYNFQCTSSKLPSHITHHYIQYHLYCNSDFSKSLNVNSNLQPYQDYEDQFKQIEKILTREDDDIRYIYTYISAIDELSHKHGPQSKEVTEKLDEIYKHIELIEPLIKKNNACLIITADHGQTNISPKKAIAIKDNDEIVKYFSEPVAGEDRSPFFYIKEKYRNEFPKIFKKIYPNFGELKKGSQMLEENFFGVNQPQDNFIKSLPDYIGIPNPEVTLMQYIGSEEHKKILGAHGSLTPEEMIVNVFKIS